MKSISWIGSKGNKIELTASCETTVIDDTCDADGYTINCGKKLYTNAALWLWIDGEKKSFCRDTYFWKLIEVKDHPGLKMVWGLRVLMDCTQAEKVEKFLQEVIEEGMSAEAKEFQEAETAKEKAKQIKKAESIIEAAKHTYKNANGTLMSERQSEAWKARYNDINNDGGEGYVPEVITQESYDWALSILNK